MVRHCVLNRDTETMVNSTLGVVDSKAGHRPPETKGKEIRRLTFRCVAESDANGKWTQLSVEGHLEAETAGTAWLLPSSQML
jgi:hypothetical protein